MRSLKHFIWLLAISAVADPRAPDPQTPTASPELLLREVRYAGALTDSQARFVVSIDADSLTKRETSVPLFEGEVAVLPAKLPAGLRLTRSARVYRLIASRPGHFQFNLELVAKITRAEPWNQVSFTGPAAGIASVAAEAGSPGVEVQLLSGTPAEPAPGDTGRVRGVLGAERLVSVRWQSKSAETACPALVTAETAATVAVTPTVIKFTTEIRYEILQGHVSQLSVTLPTHQSLTRVEGELIRDWQSRPDGNHQVLTVELIKPVEKTYALKLFSEQTIDPTPSTARLTLPQPGNINRESGSLTVLTEDASVETEPAASLRQVDAPPGALAAYRFYARPIALDVKVRRIEPVINAVSRVSARLEESRLVVSHAITLAIERAGVYTIELSPLGAFTVTEVRGEGIEDWTTRDGRLLVSFSSRVLGERALTVQLERPEKAFPNRISLAPLNITGATRQIARISAAAVPGIQLKTAELMGLREIPVASLSNRTDELLAYAADQPEWSLQLAAEKLAPRIVADVFNLVTIGDGVVGGSATLRYVIANQGVAEFKVRLPAHWRNIEFTGPNVRRKELLAAAPGTTDTNTVTWSIGLQDKAWGGYTLVVNYDEPFDPQQATLSIGGLHALDAERETGSVAITCAASLQLREIRASGSLHRIDEADLAPTDRALITRSVLLAYRYGAGDPYQLEVGVTRFQELPVLEAVADRTQLTTVLTEAGQMLTQASFMVKNNGKQFQKFALPAGAEFWSALVDGQTVKAERQDGSLLVPLPRGTDRDRAFAVDLVYAQSIGVLASLRPRELALVAPKTDVQTTFAEWELYVPSTHQLARFGGNMSVAPGTTYGWREAWGEFTETYREALDLDGVLLGLGAAVLLMALTIAAIRRGWQGVAAVAAGVVVLGVLSGMLLPALTKAKAKSQRISAFNNLKMDGYQFEPANRAVPGASPAPPVQLSETPPSLGALSLQIAPAPATEERLRLMTETSSPSGRTIATAVSGLAGAPALGVPLAQGIRPIRIEVPRAGRRFVFTKVLNVGEEALRVEAWAVLASVWTGVRSALQASVFLAGLFLLWRQLRRPTPSSFLIALALAAVLGSVVSLLIVSRWLGVALVAAAPLLLLAVLAYGVWRFTRRHGASPSTTTTTDVPRPSAPPHAPGMGPAVAAIALLWFVNAASAKEAPQTTAAASDPGFSIPSAVYTGTVRQRVAEISAVIQLSAAKPGETIPLFGEDVAVESFAATPRDAVLLRQGNSVNVRLLRKGDATVTVKVLTKLAGDVTRRRLEFGVPPALSSRLTLTLDEPEAAVEFPTAVAYHLVDLSQQTRIEAVMGAGDRVQLQWAPRGKRATEIAATVFCQNSTLVTFGGGVLKARSQFDYQVTQGEVREVRLRLPAGERLSRVTGEAIRTWRVTDDGAAPLLTVELLKGMPANYRLTIETERAADTVSGVFAVSTPHALEMKRETGLVGLSASDELGLTIDTASGLQQVDAAEFDRAIGQTNAVTAAYRFLEPDFALKVRVETLQPRVEAEVANRVRIGVEQVSVAARIDYTIKRAGVFALRIALPDGFRVESVNGRDLAQWVEKPTPSGRILEVTLKQRTLGRYTLDLQLVESQKALPKSLAIAGAHPLGVMKLTGFVVVSSDVGVQVRAVSFDGLTEVPVTSVPDGGSGLAYKFIPKDPVPAQPSWKLAVATDTVEPWVRAEVVNWLTVSESLVSGRAVVRYEIQNAPVKEFRLSLPAEFKNVDIAGANIRRRDQDGGTWRVELQNRVVGVYVLTVTWEQPWNLQEGAVTALDARGVSAPGVERETGALAVLAKPELQVTPKEASSELIRIDPQELPEWAGAPGPITVLAYRYLRPGYKLSLAAQRFAPAEVLQALADHFRLTTVVADDGQMMSELSLLIRNNGRQFLEITLPKGAQAWSAFVAGQAVRPCLRGGKLLLPVERAGEAPIPVGVTYVSAEKFPRTQGNVTLESPALDVPIKNAQWEVYLPVGYRYSRFAGTMTHDATAAPVYSGFTLTEYSAAEDRGKGARDREAASSLDAVRRTLSVGKLEDASKAYSQARRFGRYAAGEEEKLKQVEKDLRKAQVSNLLSAQQGVVRNNAAYFGRAADQPTQHQAQRYDEQAAEQQWDKLQQAQDVAATVVHPLRLNLPTRGLRQTFSQVLQTEVGVPMRIRFAASNRKAASWPARFGLAAAGFAGLWSLVSLTLGQRKAIAPASGS